jgi:2-polyprenyl-3-methyl-5-hydroxy-6-metoxy-1,4-benzoquinol methylase
MSELPQLQCPVCAYRPGAPRSADLGSVRGNTERFGKTQFRLWKCPECSTIIAVDPVDFHDIYSDYPLNKRRLDVFARGTLGNLLRRLERAGMRPTDRILDYGCGNNIFADFLKARGYTRAAGYDPYVPEHARLPREDAPFDVVVNNDTLEHGEDIHGMVEECLGLLGKGGLLYIGTADSEPVDMADLEPHVMRLHQPFHRIIVTEQRLHAILRRFEVDVVDSYTRSYHDTRRPFANYRFLDELNRALGHNLDRAMDAAAATGAFLRSPRLWFFALFGYGFPSAAEPAIVVRKR